MGNTKSSSSSSAGGCLRRTNDGNSSSNSNNDNVNLKEAPLAMMAVARKIFLKKVHILLLRYSMAKLSDDFGMIQRQGFDLALAKAKLSKIEIFDLLFTMWDNAENGKVSYKEFCMGISPLACPSEDLSVILEFALRVSDDINRKSIERKELHELLTGINSTASYFGDTHLQSVEIDRIVEAVFDKQEVISHEWNSNMDHRKARRVKPEVISHEDCVKLLIINPYVKRFASGKARLNLRFRDILETNYIFDKEKLVTEYIVDDIDALITSKCDNENEDISQTEESLSPEREHKNVAAPTTNNCFVDVPLSDKSETRDENSGVQGNSITTIEGCRDPPPLGKSSNQKTIEISFSTYRPSTIITPSTTRDPPPTAKLYPSSLHSFGNEHRISSRTTTYH